MTRFYEVSGFPNRFEAMDSRDNTMASAGAAALGQYARNRTASERGVGTNSGSLDPNFACGSSSAWNELGRLMSAGQLDLAVERFLTMVLQAGLEATFAAGSPVAGPSQLPAQMNSTVLSKREREVAALIAAGRTNRSIADELFIAPSTVERHVANMLNKLGFASRTQIAAWAVTAGLASA